MKLVIHPPVDEGRLSRIREAAGSMQVVNAADEQQAIAEMPDADAFFGKLVAPMLAQAQKLRWVQSPTASLEHFVFPELVAHPCVLTNMRGLFHDVLASHVFAYILCFARNLHLYLRQQMRGQWAPIGGDQALPDFATGPGAVSPMDRAHLHVGDCTLGIVGFGSIGSEIARCASAFGMRVVAVDPKPMAPPAGVAAVWPLDRLNDLLAESDFVVIAAPHTPQTEGLFGREQFRRMKPSAYLINIGRGAIVRLDALVEALDADEIAGAALDVFEIEPLPPDHPLWSRENVLLTPHVGASSVRVPERHLETLLDNIRRFAAGKPLRNVASKTEWY